MYVMESAPGARTIINGREVDYFGGTGYLGLQGHPELVKAVCEATRRYGVATATSRFGYGDNPVLLDVEKRAAAFFGTESALYYVSGYLGNAILLQGLIIKYDVILIDEASHYSVFDGTYTTRKPIIPFAHLDAEDLQKKIRNSIKPSQRPLMICDGVFPVSGEISPIPDYVGVLEEFAPYIVCVDDAHATGVLGEKGRGVYDYFGLEAGDGLHASGTLSKAVGGHGGIIAGREMFIDGLRKSSEIFQGASPVSTPAAAAASKGLEILMNRPELRKNLWANVRYAKNALRSIGFDIPDTPVPIICLYREGIDLRQMQAELFRKEIAVLYAAGGSYSSVPKNGAIRIAIFSTHSKEQIDRLVKEIQRLMSTLA